MSCTEVGTGLPAVVRVDSSSYWSKMEAMMMLAPLYTFSYDKKATTWNLKLQQKRREQMQQHEWGGGVVMGVVFQFRIGVET